MAGISIKMEERAQKTIFSEADNKISLVMGSRSNKIAFLRSTLVSRKVILSTLPSVSCHFRKFDA